MRDRRILVPTCATRTTGPRGGPWPPATGRPPWSCPSPGRRRSPSPGDPMMHPGGGRDRAARCSSPQGAGPAPRRRPPEAPGATEPLPAAAGPVLSPRTLPVDERQCHGATGPPGSATGRRTPDCGRSAPGHRHRPASAWWQHSTGDFTRASSKMDEPDCAWNPGEGWLGSTGGRPRCFRAHRCCSGDRA